MSQSLVEWLKSGPVLVADGATGTMLQAAGLPAGVIPEQWNLEQPAKITALHQAYLEAGSRIIVSNTFGGNRIKLGRAKQADLAPETNRRAVELARAAAEPYGAFVAADMGPTGELLEPYGEMTFAAAVETYAEQARFLAEAGADALWLETLSDVNEARAAIEGIQKVTALPILCSFSFDSHGRTMMGLTPKKAAETLGSLGLAALGANCGASLEDTVEAVTAIAGVLPGPAVDCETECRPAAPHRRAIGIRHHTGRNGRVCRAFRGARRSHRGWVLRQHSGAHRCYCRSSQNRVNHLESGYRRAALFGRRSENCVEPIGTLCDHSDWRMSRPLVFASQWQKPIYTNCRNCDDLPVTFSVFSRYHVHRGFGACPA